MKTLKYFLTLFLVGVGFFSCDVEYFSDPNNPEVAPTYGLMNRVQKQFMSETRDEWYSGRQMLLWVQYWNQVNYTEEDRFQYRETVNEIAWDDIYTNAQDLHDIIALNTNEETSGDMAQFGPNVNQIAAARIMLVYVYLHAVELWGDVPYASYGAAGEGTFQANQLKTEGIDQPAYATQENIYADMLKELDEAAESIIESENMIDGDNFYNGDASQWKKLANSLRLRIANRIKDVYSGAQAHIDDAIASGVMESNADNAGVTFEANAVNGAPMYQAFVVDARTDFAPSMQFVELLKGQRGPFSVEDPRLDIYVADNENGDKVGVPLTQSNDVVGGFKLESMPGDAILAPDYTTIYMEYAEVCFIMSELNNWDQEWYENGVRASMERWGVAADAIDAYVAELPAASEETVMMQKYIALYMQSLEAWSEYRRTGYPNTIVRPNDPYTYTWPTADGTASETYEFIPIGGLTDLPERNKYPLNEYSINEENVKAAADRIGGDEQDTKLWWAD
ncbi:MAG: SusD/RagB family nutrient-binding outer membrane lipoprotein [Bacteroidota bacterium]